MGTVYKAKDPVLDRLIALKTVSPELLTSDDARERFQREARAAARLQHPNIVTIFELGEAGGVLFIAMELLDGMDLAEAMSPPHRLSLSQKVRVIVEVCRGLDYAHKRGVVHRDVKPANVRLLPDGSVKLVDFGIARVGESTMTQTGMVMGTPSYLAPEILSGGRVDHRADMWAAGVVLHELLTGQRPFRADTFVGLAYRIVHEPLAPLPPVQGPPALAGVVARALAKDPAGRYPDMAEMADALARAAGLAVSAGSGLPGDDRAEAARRHLDDARRRLAEGDLEEALGAARRAQALDPAGPAVLALVEHVESALKRGPRAVPAAVTTPSPRRLPTPVLTELRARGAAVFRELATFGEPPPTQATCLSPVADLMATAGADGSIRLWDLQARTRAGTLRTDLHVRTGHDARALSLAYSPDGLLLASGHVDGAVHLWDLRAGVEVPARLKHDAMVGAVAFSPDGAVLASGGMDNALKLWEVAACQAGEARRTLHRQPAGVTAVAYAGGGRFLLTGHVNHIVRLLDAGTGRLQATLRGPEAQVSLLCPSPDGRRVAVASHDRSVRLFDLDARAEVAAMPSQRKPAASVCFFGDGRHLATVALDNAVHLWDMDSGSSLAALWGPASESFAGVALFGEGDHLAVALADGRIRLWEPAV